MIESLNSLGYFRFKNILSACIVHDPARVCDHEDSLLGNSPHLFKRSMSLLPFFSFDWLNLLKSGNLKRHLKEICLQLVRSFLKW